MIDTAAAEAITTGALHTIDTAESVHAPGLMVHVLVTAEQLARAGYPEHTQRVLAAWARAAGIDY